MKKKLLSLVLAGAMVASTSVSAFAADDTVVRDNNGTANVTINGSVYGNDGQIPSGTINVSVPTALNFKVAQNGDVTGSEIKIANNGMEAVDISAVSFTDKTPNKNITVVSPSELQDRGTKTRDKVALWIRGNRDTQAYFKSVDISGDESGIINNLGRGQDSETGIKVSTINPQDKGTLTLEGFAGTQQLTENETSGVTDEFTLILKIGKASQ